MYVFLLEHFGHDHGKRLWMKGQKLHDMQERAKYYMMLQDSAVDVLKGQRPAALEWYRKYKWKPVGVEEFVVSKDYLDKAGEIYPEVLRNLIEINSGKYHELVATGGIGSAKTTLALYSLAYQLYLMSCLRNPHELFGLDSASEILLIFQSINAKISKASYDRFQSMIEHSPYFQNHFPHNKDMKSKLVFPHRIEVVPISGAETGAIGQNVVGGLIDELNYMSVVERSKQSVDKGTYDQAVALYNSIARRRKTRFMKAGSMPGLLCLVSSKRYPGQFTDMKEEEAKNDESIFIYDKRVWEVKPEGTFSGLTFDVFVGDESRKPKVLTPEDSVSDEDRHLVMQIPVEFREDFDGPGADIINALREIAGVSTLARHPYFVDTDAVSAMFSRHHSIFSREEVDFYETKVAAYPKLFVRPELPRFAHIDLAISGDSAGLVIGTVTGFDNLKNLGYGTNEDEYMPMIHIDGMLEIKPPKGGEIPYWKIRELLVNLRKLGLNIRWVTFDSFQSTDSIQLLKAQGFICGIQSMDVNSKPYDFLKSAVYSGRVAAPKHTRCKRELVSLEKDSKTGKIDHPPSGSKDVSDSLAGVVYGLTNRREIWAMYKVPLVTVPSSIASAMAISDAKVTG